VTRNLQTDNENPEKVQDLPRNFEDYNGENWSTPWTHLSPKPEMWSTCIAKKSLGSKFTAFPQLFSTNGPTCEKTFLDFPKWNPKGNFELAITALWTILNQFLICPLI
jgi:hypothetical protein